MALFPDCTFNVYLPNEGTLAGQRLVGTLELIVPTSIPRADHLDIVFKTEAWAGYGSGKQRSVVRRTLFVAPLRVDLVPGASLLAGKHRYPFAIDVPAGLPPALPGADCGITHSIDVRLDVDWAVDPKITVVPTIHLEPVAGQRTPLITRTPPSFHDKIVLEVTMPSSTLVWGKDRAKGMIALRAGGDARFDAICVSLASRATMRMARGDQRRGFMMTTRIPALALRDGRSVPFAIPVDKFPPSFRNGFIDHDVDLVVSAEIPWAFDPELVVPLRLLPAGSTVTGSLDAPPIGFERVRRHATAMAAATNLRPGHASPVLVEGSVGPVDVTIDDAPAGGRLGVAVSFHFPDVELGTVFRPLGVLDGFRDSSLLPSPLGNRYLLRVESHDARPAWSAQRVAPFYLAALRDLDGADEVHLTDHHLKLHFHLSDDSSAEMASVAEAAHARARRIGEAIADLPWPAAASALAPAWQATAAEQNAILVATGPSLHGLVMSSRVLGGEVRAMRFAIRTDWRKTGPVTRVDVELRDASIPKSAGGELEEATAERLRSVHTTFPVTHALAIDHLTLERPEVTADPRTLWPALEALFQWVLDVRGERRAVHAYR